MKLLTKIFASLLLLSSCMSPTAMMKYADDEYKYDAAKAAYAEGKYQQASLWFGEVLAALKGSAYGEESLYMLAMSVNKCRDYESAASYFRKYYQSYPKGVYAEEARYRCGYALYKMVADTRLDQTNTHEALDEFLNFLEHYPQTKLKNQTQDMIYKLQDKLIEKEYLSAKLYYDLGSYINNCAYGGSNYEACIITAQNALKDFPYANVERREAFSILILRAKYHLAKNSVEEKRIERYRDVVDEFYGFLADFPESKYLEEVTAMQKQANNFIRKRNLNLDED